MNHFKPLSHVSRLLDALLLQWRSRLPPGRCCTFTQHWVDQAAGIGPIYVINLDRQPQRWNDVLRELSRVLDAAGRPLSERTIRFSACDARSQADHALVSSEIQPLYNLGDQLFVEPQPRVAPAAFDLTRPIRMSREEVAVASSHIGVWKEIAQSDAPYALVLEDDVWIQRRFGRMLDSAWREMEDVDKSSPSFDLFYVSYKEVRYGAPKQLFSQNVFRPERGLWYLSGYVLSRRGAQTLLSLLPVRGPIDLWINHKFREVEVRALKRSVINQRLDTPSTNSYSVLPTLSRIGILDYGETALFHQWPVHFPVFAFGPPGSGLSSLAMALSMLGYRCCSDLEQLPDCELDRLVGGSGKCIFNAYVNVASLWPHVRALVRLYPRAKFILMGCASEVVESRCDDAAEIFQGADALRLDGEDARGWRVLCEFLTLAPPVAPYPVVKEIGQRRERLAASNIAINHPAVPHRSDRSPWVVERHARWTGIDAMDTQQKAPLGSTLTVEDDLSKLEPSRWFLRDDTFPGNLALFRPANVTAHAHGGRSLSVCERPLGVRSLSAGAISSRERFLYGRFEATLTATNVPGLVTGFFLHRDSPRQEIDIELMGNRPTQLLVNVFYNPGIEGAKFDYGYRGTPIAIPLGFDASKAAHKFAIEWGPCEIRWYVEGDLIHRRAIWDPTPIPHLPMTLHVNTWATRSRKLAGRLALRALPASAIVRSIAIDASLAGDDEWRDDGI